MIKCVTKTKVGIVVEVLDFTSHDSMQTCSSKKVAFELLKAEAKHVPITILSTSKINNGW